MRGQAFEEGIDMTGKGPLDEKATRATGEALQGALVDLIDLSLTAKQAHWNLRGRNFRSLHLQLDEIVTAARGYADDVAERAVAIGFSPDGRVATLAASTPVAQLGDGWVQDTDVVPHLVGLYHDMVERMRARIESTGETDAVTQDLLISLTAELEKQAWMLRAQQE